MNYLYPFILCGQCFGRKKNYAINGSWIPSSLKLGQYFCPAKNRWLLAGFSQWRHPANGETPTCRGSMATVSPPVKVETFLCPDKWHQQCVGYVDKLTKSSLHFFSLGSGDDHAMKWKCPWKNIWTCSNC